MKNDAVTELILEVFRLNGALIAAGDAIVEDLGLTSARWQVLGAVAFQEAPAPVVRLAESMGLTRQSVQRIVNELAAEGVLAFADNPHHQRAKLIVLTSAGRSLYAAAQKRQGPWAQRLAARVSAGAIKDATETLARLRAALTGDAS